MSDEQTASAIPDYTDDYLSALDEQKTLTVKEMDLDDQPRERARKYGIHTLSNADLLAMILRTGTRGYPVTALCRDLMKMNENFIGNLERCSIEQLMEINGIGELKAYQIMAVMEIVRRSHKEKVGERPQIKNSKDLFNMMRFEIGNAPYEEIWVIYLNRANRVVGKMRVSSGGSTSSVFDLKKIMKNALLAHAEAIAMCHNHPSGTLLPSGPDDQITRKLKDACSQLDMVLLDHVIITFNGFYSYRDSARII